MIFDLVQDFAGALAALPDGHRRRQLLALLDEAVRRDAHFVGRHPTALFQCLWNSCWWYDCPEAARHYERPEGAAAPWEGGGPKLSAAAAGWLARKAQATPGFAWLRSLRPPATPLGSGQRLVLDFPAGRVALSPGGRLAARRGPLVRVWDTLDGRELGRFDLGDSAGGGGPTDADPGPGPAWRGDDELLVPWGRSLFRVDLSGWRELFPLDDPAGRAALSADGSRLAVPAAGGGVLVLDAADGAVVAFLDAGPVRSVALSADGARLACLHEHAPGGGGRADVWDVAARARVATCPPEGGHDRGGGDLLALAADGRRLATADWQGVSVWGADTGERVTAAGAGAGADPFRRATAVALSADGRAVAVGADDGAVEVRDATTGALLAAHAGHRGAVTSLAFDPGGRRLASSSADGTVRLRLAPDVPAAASLGRHAGRVTALAFSADGRDLAAGAADNSVGVTRWGTGVELVRVHCPGLAELHGTPELADRDWVGELDRSTRAVALALGADGTTLRAAWDNGFVLGWDLRTGAERFRLRIEGSLPEAALSADGSRLAAAMADGTVSVWDPDSGAEVARTPPAGGLVREVRLSADGRRVVGLAADGLACWDAATGAELARVRVDPHRVSALAVSADGARVAVAEKHEGGVQVHDTETGELVAYLSEGGGDLPLAALRLDHGALAKPDRYREVTALAFGPGGDLVAAGDDSGGVEVWDAAGPSVLQRARPPGGGVTALAFAPGGRALAAGSDSGAVCVWPVRPVAATPALPGHAEEVTALAVSGDRRWVLTASRDGGVCLHDGATGALAARLAVGADGRASWAVADDGRRVACVTGGGAVSVWTQGAGGPVTWPDPGDGAPGPACFSPDGGRLAAARGEVVTVWDVGAAAPLCRLDGGGGGVRRVNFSRDGRRVAAAASDGRVRVWDAATGRRELWLDPSSPGYLAAAGSPDGRRLVTAHFDRLFVWDLDRGVQSARLRAEGSFVLCLCFSGDGARVVGGTHEGEVKVWDAATGEPVGSLPAGGSVLDVQCRPRGGQVAAAVEGGPARVWDRDTGEAVAVPGGGAGPCTCVAYSPDGRRLAAGGADGSVCLWDAADFALLRRVNPHPAPVRDLAFVGGGDTVATVADDGTALVTDLVTGAELARLRLRPDPGVAWSRVAAAPDGAAVAVLAGSPTVHLWRWREGTCDTLTGHADVASAVAFCGDRLVSCGLADDIRVRDPRSRACLAVLGGLDEAAEMLGEGPRAPAVEPRPGHDFAAHDRPRDAAVAWAPYTLEVAERGPGDAVFVGHARGGREVVVLKLEHGLVDVAAGGEPPDPGWDGTPFSEAAARFRHGLEALRRDLDADDGGAAGRAVDRLLWLWRHALGAGRGSPRLLAECRGALRRVGDSLRPGYHRTDLLRLCHGVERAALRSGDGYGLALARSLRARLLLREGDHAGALRLCAGCRPALRENGDWEQLQAVLGCEAAALDGLGEPDAAAARRREQRELRRAAGACEAARAPAVRPAAPLLAGLALAGGGAAAAYLYWPWGALPGVPAALLGAALLALYALVAAGRLAVTACPACGRPALLTGGAVYCPGCDAAPPRGPAPDAGRERQ